jgi:hypothetical protein
MKQLLVTVIVLVLLSGTASAAEKVLLLRFQGTGADEELITAVTTLFQGALTEEGVYQAVSAAEALGETEYYDQANAAAMAREAGFGKVVTGSLTRLGAKIIVRVQLIKADDGTVVYSDDGVSQTEEDLDVVVARLAKSMSTGKKMEATAEVGLITEKELEQARRRESFSSKSFSVGFMWPTAKSMGGADRLVVLDLAYQYDTSDFFLAGRSGLRWGGDTGTDGGKAFDINFLEVQIGRHFGRGDVAPFLSGGIGIHYIRETVRVRTAHQTYYEESQGGTGPILLGGGGITAFRTYDFHFKLDVDYFIVLEKLNAAGSSNGGKYPQGVMVTFCVMKGRK